MTVLNMDCIEGMRLFPDAYFDSIVTDPPYELGFMGKGWDSTGIANSVEMWREALRVLKPGGHLLAFSGSRTYHRMVCAIEDAGFEVRDQIMWVYGSGFPKSLDVSKAIDKAAGAERTERPDPRWAEKYPNGPGGNTGQGSAFDGQGLGRRDSTIMTSDPVTDAARQWQGWGTALKPSHEPIVVARKPLTKGCTVAANVLAHGTGAINVDGCRVDGGTRPLIESRAESSLNAFGDGLNGSRAAGETTLGRWPANLIHDGSDEVLAAFPQANGGHWPAERGAGNISTKGHAGQSNLAERKADTGSAARFFYCAKSSKSDRNSGGVVSTHPTVKPTALMRYLCRLVTPPGGTVLDPFTGSGSTGKAAALEGFGFIGFELSAEYAAIAIARITEARK